MTPLTFPLLFQAQAYPLQATADAQAANPNLAPYTWNTDAVSQWLEQGIHPQPTAHAYLLVDPHLPPVIHLPPGQVNTCDAYPKPACSCPDWYSTLHLSEYPCPLFGGLSAHCATCGGCKACTVLKASGRFRPSAQRIADMFNNIPIRHPPTWTLVSPNPRIYQATQPDPTGAFLCTIAQQAPKTWSAFVSQLPSSSQDQQTIITALLGLHPYLARAKDHVADWLDDQQHPHPSNIQQKAAS